MRKCPIANCGELIPSSKFACRNHWFCLTAEEKRRIYSAYKRYLAGEIGFDEITRLQEEVIAAVHDRYDY